MVAHAGGEYDSKALVGAAFRHQFPDAEPLLARDFSGGDETRAVLDALGFRVVGIGGSLDDIDEADLGDDDDGGDSSAGTVPSFERLMRPTLEAVAAAGRAELGDHGVRVRRGGA